MSGLVLSLAPGERFVVNGAVLENGDKPSRVRITDRNVRVLRMRDALRPDEVDTPLKRIYYAIQLLITGDLEETGALPAILRECEAITDVFSCIDKDWASTLREMISRRNYYSALCHLKQMLSVESELLDKQAKAA